MSDGNRCGGCRGTAGSDDGTGRREVLKRALGLSLGLTVAPGMALAQEDPAASRPEQGDLLVRVGDAARTPLAPGDISIGAAPTMAWAMDPVDGTVRSGSRLNRVLLLRLEPETLAAETRSRAADGVIAYTAICTHEGCEVVDWIAGELMLACPCHVSRFDPRDGARVIEGPAPRALPALPLAVAGGRLVVAQPFTARVGFDQA
jgi:rieske iron-sulfur protein